MKLRALVAAAAVVCTGAAQAVVFTPGVIGSLDNQLVFIGSPHAEPSFIDFFVFNVSAPGFAAGATFSSGAPGITFTSLAFLNLNTLTPLLPADTNGADGWGTAVILPTAGSYALVIEGTTSGGGGIYTGWLGALVQATPVPEPESYALMLAGLGVLGFVAKRRLS